MNKKGQEVVIKFLLLLTIIVILVIAIFALSNGTKSGVERCKNICIDNNDKFYDYTPGRDSPNVCLCKETGGKIYSLNI